MRRFGRQCRGQGKIFVKLVRQTETQLLELGSSIAALAQEAHQALQKAPHLSAAKRERLASALRTAQEAPSADQHPIPTADPRQEAAPL